MRQKDEQLEKGRSWAMETKALLIFFLIIIDQIFFLAAVSLHCCQRFSLAVASEFLLAAAALVVGHRL